LAGDPVVHVTGGGGQVGLALRRVLPDAVFFDRGQLDVTDERAVRRRLGGARLVIHCAAYTDVDGCERDPARAEAVNAAGAAHVAAAAERVIHLSTDYVFDGESAAPYAEDAEPRPASAYGRSKLAGERAVLAAAGNLVVRTAWVYGEGRNFIRAIRVADAAGRELRVVDDQRGRPTWARDLARALAHLARRRDEGIVHVTGDGEPCSWADLAELVVGHPVRRVSTEEYGALAPRPRNSVLALDRARTLGVPLADWRRSVAGYLEAER
jgi:dTDP-4-dehydrorhamnose 3,5-epimerase